MPSFANDRNILAYFDRWTLEKGKDCYKRGKVQFFERSGNQVLGAVGGSKGEVYETVVSLHGNRIRKVECSCPVAVGKCKHAAALMFAYLDQIENDGQFVPTEDIAQDADAPSSAENTAKPPVSKLFDSETISEAKKKPKEERLHKAQNVVYKFQPSKRDEPPANSDLRAQMLGSVGRDLMRSFDEMRDANRIEREKKAAKQDGNLGKSRVVYLLNNPAYSSNPQISFAVAALNKDGSYGMSTPTEARRILDRRPKYASEEDIEIARLFEICDLQNEYRFRGWRYASEPPFVGTEPPYDPELFGMLLSRILRTNRCHFGSLKNPPLKMGLELPGQLKWFNQANYYQTLQLVINAKHAEAPNTSIECMHWNIPWYVDKSTWTLGPLITSYSQAVLTAALDMRPVHEREAKFLPLLLRQHGLLDSIPLPNGVVLRTVEKKPTIEIKTVSREHPIWGPKGIIQDAGEPLKIAIVKDDTEQDTEHMFDQSDGTTVIEIHQQLPKSEYQKKFEDMGFQMIPSHWLDFSARDGCFATNDPANWLEFIESRLPELREQGWNIDNSVESEFKAIEIDDSDLEFTVSDEDEWWFSLELNIEVDGKPVSLLPIMISALRQIKGGGQITAEAIDGLNRNGKFVATLRGGEIVTIPFDRVRAILFALQELINRDASVRISMSHAMSLMDDETLSRARWIGADRIRTFIEQMRLLLVLPKAEPPEKFNTELRSYQLEGLAWLQLIARNNLGGILADDMGLGKTVQLLAHVCLEKEAGRLDKPFLVVCPTSVLPNWMSECEKFAPHLKVLALSGKDRVRKHAELRDYDIVVTTYPIVFRDEEVLKYVEWHGVALDEAQVVKNAATKVAQAVRRLKAGHRFCVSGTPIENHLGELWAHFSYIMPGLLGDHRTFTRNIRTPIEKEGNTFLRKALATRVRPFVLRRTKSEVELQLPEKTEIVRHVRLEGPQRDLYETARIASTKKVRDQIEMKGFRQSQIMILDALLKLRQACCDPRLVKITEARKVKSSAKLEALMIMLLELTQEGRKILVFSQFTSMLDLIAEELIRNKLDFVQLRGDTTDRTKPVRRFQEEDVQIFLISLKAGGTGLNLTAADTVIHYDPWWNPAVEQQATDRAHRIGQTKNVFVYKLIAEGTIEQRMLQLQDRKRVLANCIYDEKGNMSRSFSEDDLTMLLCPIDEL
jgi:SNF2 family DNA or RNA helicase